MSISLSDDEPTYSWIIDNYMAWRSEGGGEYIAALPSDCNEHDCSEIGDLMIMASDFIDSQGNCNDSKGYYL